MTTDAGTLPLDRIFVKQRLDLLTARAWLDNDAKLRNKVRRTRQPVIHGASGICTPYRTQPLEAPCTITHQSVGC